MTTRRELLTAAPVAGAFVAFGPTAFTARSIALAQEGTAPGPLWRSPSLVEKTVTGPNGEITTRDMIEANARLAMTEKRAIEIAPDVWLLAGWGIAHSMAIRAPEGWIIVDTGDSTRAAKEMREKLEWAVGGPIRVAAILLTHWHYSNGTAAWSDEGAELWGHEWLDRNRAAGTGVGPLAGFYQARAISQFAVFHPTKGADAFPNNLRFSPEKLLANPATAHPFACSPMGWWNLSLSPGKRWRSCPTGRTAPIALASIFLASGYSYPTLWRRALFSTSSVCAAVHSAIRKPTSKTIAAWSPTTPLPCLTSMPLP